MPVRHYSDQDLMPVPLVSAPRARAIIRTWATELDHRHRWAGIGLGQNDYDLLNRSEGDGYIYFALATTGVIKIGFSTGPNARIRNLWHESKGGEDFAPLVCIDRQSKFNEGLFHEELERHRLHGEFYKPGRPLISLAYRLANAAEACLHERFYQVQRRMKKAA